MLIAPFLAFIQGGDPRLAVRATLERPRVTFAEFGAWVQNRAHVPVTVSPAIRERKATVLVADRPVGETMRAFAETFFLEWERTATGYRLRMVPKVAAEEGDALEAEALAREAAFRRALETIMALGKLSREEIDERANAATAEDPNSLALSRYAHDPASLAAGELLAGLPPAERAAVLAGRRAFGSDKAGTGMVAVSKRWGLELGEEFAGMDGPSDSEDAVPKVPKPADGVFVTIKGDPATGRLLVTASPKAADGETLGESSTTVEGDEIGAVDGLLGTRLAAWAKAGEDGLFATKLEKDTEPMAIHSSSRHTLADLLVVLHRRSGLPIVADGFREAASGRSVPNDSNVKGWLAALADGPMAGTPSYLARASKGWIEMRRSQYWRRLAAEPSESAVVALERGVRSMDLLAAFAQKVTPVQEEHLGAGDLVMDAPNAAVDGKLGFLRLWGALSPSQRKQALDDGLLLSSLSGDAARLAMEVVGRIGGEESAGDDLVRYFLPDGPPLPLDLAFSVEARDDMSDYELPPFSRRPSAKPPEPILHGYRGFAGRLQGAEQTFMSFEFPLQEKPVVH